MTVSKNLKGYWLRSSDVNKSIDLLWYDSAKEYALSLSNEFEIPFKTVAAIIAVLSPGCTWSINKKDAYNLLLANTAFHNLATLRKLKVSTYGQNKSLAISILHGFSSFMPTATNQKTWNFYSCILNPSSLDHVAIDRHAFKAYKGIKSGGSIIVSVHQYTNAKLGYITLANTLGVVPCGLQAVVWEQYKREVNR